MWNSLLNQPGKKIGRIVFKLYGSNSKKLESAQIFLP